MNKDVQPLQAEDVQVAPVHELVKGWRRELTFALLALVAMVSYIDRQIFTLFQDDVKAELGLTDGQLGLLTGLSFAFFYSLASFPIARYADRGDRGMVVGICVIIWSCATAFCGLAQNFWQMMLARVGLAAGEAGAGPASTSLLTEIYPPERRTTVIAVLMAANSVGISGGLAVGGWLSNWFGWREIFFILGVPGVLLGLVVWMVTAEPRRLIRKGTLPVKPPVRYSLKDVVRVIGGNTSLRWAAFAMATVSVTGFSMIIWSASFFQRVHQLSKAETGLWLGGAMAAGLVIGNLLSGWFTDRFGQGRPEFNGWFAGIGLLIAFPCALTFALTSNAYLALAAFVCVKFFMTLYMAPTMSLCYAQVPLEMRATLSATIGLIIGMAGTGLGATVAGFISGMFAPEYGDLSLQPALAVMSVFLLLGGISVIMAGRKARSEDMIN